MAFWLYFKKTFKSSELQVLTCQQLHFISSKNKINNSLILITEEGKRLFLSKNKVTYLKWHDKRIVTMLSTFHSDEMIEEQGKPMEVSYTLS